MITLPKLALALLTVVTVGWPSFGNSADIDKFPLGEMDGYMIRGEIVADDAKRFLEIIGDTDRHAVVFLDSPGGLVGEGLMIGSMSGNGASPHQCQTRNLVHLFAR